MQMSAHKFHGLLKGRGPCRDSSWGRLGIDVQNKVALPRGASWRGGWMRWAGPVLPGRVFLCVAPRAGGVGCEPTRAGSAVEAGSALSRWSRGSVTGETARCRVCSGKGKVCCRSRAISLQVTGSGWRRAPVGCGGFAGFVSSGLRVALVPRRGQSARSSRRRAPCSRSPLPSCPRRAHLRGASSTAWRQPLARGERVLVAL